MRTDKPPDTPNFFSRPVAVDVVVVVVVAVLIFVHELWIFPSWMNKLLVNAQYKDRKWKIFDMYRWK